MPHLPQHRPNPRVVVLVGAVVAFLILGLVRWRSSHLGRSNRRMGASVVMWPRQARYESVDGEWLWCAGLLRLTPLLAHARERIRYGTSSVDCGAVGEQEREPRKWIGEPHYEGAKLLLRSIHHVAPRRHLSGDVLLRTRAPPLSFTPR